MALSLYEVTVPSFLQVLDSTAGFLEKGLAHCAEHKIDPAEFVESRLYPDMLPLRFQIQSVAHHSLGAIEGVKAGLFKPGAAPAEDYAAMQMLVADAAQGLRALSPADVDALEGRDVLFQVGDRKLPFIGKDFLLSFSQPNFYFHATTAYDILRNKGVPLGKRNFLGKMRMKAA